MRKALALLYLVAVPALATAAAWLWQLRCEGFGCMGIGVAWLVWVLAYVPVLALGAALAGGPALQGPLRTPTRLSLGIQIALGITAAVLWALQQIR